MDTAADRIGFAIREGRRYVDGGMVWYVCLQGQGETGLYSGSINRLSIVQYVSTASVPPSLAQSEYWICQNPATVRMLVISAYIAPATKNHIVNSHKYFA